MGWISILELNSDVIELSLRLWGQLNIIFADKTALRSSSALPWPGCCPSAAVCSLLEGGSAIVCGTLCASDPWYNPGQKEKHHEKKAFVLVFCLFVCFSAQISLIWSMKWSPKQLCWHIWMRVGAGIKGWRAVEEGQLILPPRNTYHVTNPNSSQQKRTRSSNLLNYKYIWFMSLTL